MLTRREATILFGGAAGGIFTGYISSQTVNLLVKTAGEPNASPSNGSMDEYPPQAALKIGQNVSLGHDNMVLMDAKTMTYEPSASFQIFNRDGKIVDGGTLGLNGTLCHGQYLITVTKITPSANLKGPTVDIRIEKR